MDIEDTFMWYNKKGRRFYSMFHTHDFIGMITSKNGIDWENSNQYKPFPKSFNLVDDSLLKSDRMECPFLYQENGQPKVLASAIKKGNESYSVFVPIKKNMAKYL